MTKTVTTLEEAARPKTVTTPPLAPLEVEERAPLSRARASSSETVQLLDVATQGLAATLRLQASRTDNPRAAAVVDFVAGVVEQRGAEAAALVVDRLCSARSRGGVDRGAVLSSDLTAAEAGELTEALQQLEADDLAAARAGLNLAGALLGQALRILVPAPAG